MTVAQHRMELIQKHGSEFGSLLVFRELPCFNQTTYQILPGKNSVHNGKKR